MFSPTANFEWMSFNIFLAFMGVLWGYLFYVKKLHHFKGIIMLLWVLFLPNTFYLVSDLGHLPDQLQLTHSADYLFLFAEYFLLFGIGIITFDMSVSLLDAYLRHTGLRKFHIGIIIMLNMAVGFAIILGKVQRTHSWYIFTDFNRVMHDIQVTLSSEPLLKLVLIIGIFGNIVYFSTHRLGDWFDKELLSFGEKGKGNKKG